LRNEEPFSWKGYLYDREYFEVVVAKMLEYLFDADNIVGAGRLYLP
jgi:hypothetical protein